MPIRPDIMIEIRENIPEPAKTVIRTNAKPEALEEILEAWLREQMGAGADQSTPTEREVYTVKLALDLSDDTFSVESDTGNESLTTGIVMRVFRDLKHLTVEPLT